MSGLSPKEVAFNALTNALIKFDPVGAEPWFAADYIQHNPVVPTGAANFFSLFPAIQASGLKATTHRVICDETLIAFDILRIENGKAAEHWDNLQVPPTQTASGRSMTDGSVEIVDFEKTEENKAFVERFWTEVFVLGLVEKLAEFISSEPGAFIQHDPLITDGIDGLAEALKTFAENGKLYSYTKIHKILGEGNFVFSMSEGKIGEVPSAFFDLVRVENGKIVEHWNTVMEIPNQWAHENGSNIFTNLITDYWFRFNSCMNGHSVKF